MIVRLRSPFRSSFANYKYNAMLLGQWFKK